MQLTAAAIDGVMAVNFLSDLGFAKTGTVNYDSADPTDCAFTWGVKNVSDGSGTDEYGFYLGTVFMNGVELDASRFFSGRLINDDSVVEYLIVEIPFTPGEPQPAEPVRPESKPDPKLPVRIPVPENPAVPGDSRPEKAPVLNIPGQPAPQTGSTAPAAETPAAEPVLPFTDVAADNAWLNGIRYVYESGIMNGVSDTGFDPQGTLTRAMLVTILRRMEQIDPEEYDTVSFTDVDPIGTWNYAPYVEWAARNGIVLGYGDGTFGPMDPVTCEQAVLMLQRYARYLGYGADAENEAAREGVSEWPPARSRGAWKTVSMRRPTGFRAIPPAAAGWRRQSTALWASSSAEPHPDRIIRGEC